MLFASIAASMAEMGEWNEDPSEAGAESMKTMMRVACAGAQPPTCSSETGPCSHLRDSQADGRQGKRQLHQAACDPVIAY
jgi:hypothetical protein